MNNETVHIHQTTINISVSIGHKSDIPFNKSLTIISHASIQPYSHTNSHLKIIIIPFVATQQSYSSHIISIASP